MAKKQTEKPVVRRLSGLNEFSINIGTENGSGSQTANLTLLRAIFKMGIPVSGKNIFPSNIQGLPTWYKIRVSQSGYVGRRKEADIVVAMNPKTFTEDQDDLVAGGLFLYADDIKDPIERKDMISVAMPVKHLVKEAKPHRDLRKFVANMVYVGILANLLEIDLEPIKAALEFHFKVKESPVEFNMMMIELAYQWAEENLDLEILKSNRATLLTTQSWLMEIQLPGWVRFMGECILYPGIPSHPQQVCQKLCWNTLLNCGLIRKPGRAPMPLSRQRTNWLL